MDLRDIKVTDSNGDVYYQSPDVPVVCTPAVASVGATLMKTGQTTSYRTGDDGDLEKGRATDFLTLASNNPFGNTNRFTDELGGQTYTNDIVIDWSTYDGSTVLGYKRTLSATAVVWNDAIDGALTVSIGAFTTGWRLPNIYELVNIANFNLTSFSFINYAPFNITEQYLWSSNTLVASSTLAYRVEFYGSFTYQAKTQLNKYIPVRTFTVTGTTLS